jgi:hypothetical protein
MKKRVSTIAEVAALEVRAREQGAAFRWSWANNGFEVEIQKHKRQTPRPASPAEFRKRRPDWTGLTAEERIRAHLDVVEERMSEVDEPARDRLRVASEEARLAFKALRDGNIDALLLAQERMLAMMADAGIANLARWKRREMSASAGRGNSGQRRWHTAALQALIMYAKCHGMKPKQAYERVIERYDEGSEEDNLIDAMDAACGAPVYIENLDYDGYAPKERGRVLFQLTRKQGHNLDTKKITVGIFQDAVAELNKPDEP